MHRPDGAWLRLPAAEGDALLLPVAEDGYQGVYARPAAAAGARVGRRRADATSTRACSARCARSPSPRTGAASTPSPRSAARRWRRCGCTPRPGTEIDAAADRPARRRPGALDRAWRRAWRTTPSPPGSTIPSTRPRAAAPGSTEEQLRAYAPEFHPRFALRWLAVPPGGGDRRPAALPGAAGPRPRVLGLPELDAHPSGAARPPVDRRRPAGRGPADHRPRGQRACSPSAPTSKSCPTLSMRTVALAADPVAAPQTPPGHRHVGPAQPAHHQARHPRRRRRGAAAAGGGDRARAPLPGHDPARRRDDVRARRARAAGRPVPPLPGRSRRLRRRPDGRAAAPRRPAGGWSSTTSPTASTAAIRSPCWTPA